MIQKLKPFFLNSFLFLRFTVFTTVLSGIKGLMTTIRHGQYDHIYLHKKNCIVNVSHLGNY